MERADPEGNGRLWLALTRKTAGSAELFAAMACDVVGALDDAVPDTLLKLFNGENTGKLVLALTG